MSLTGVRLTSACLLFVIVTAMAPETGGETVAKPWWEWKSVKVAAVQMAGGEVDTVDKMVFYVRRAAADDAQLIAFPEYALGRFSIPCAIVDRIAQAAREHRIYVVVAGWEEFEPGAIDARKPGAFSNTTLILGRDGSIVGKFSKVHGAVGEPPYFHPPNPDEPEHIMEAGAGYPTYQLDFGRIGVMTCYDGYFAESADCLSLNGAEIIIWNNGRNGSIEDYLVKADMFRSFCAIVATNLAQGEGTMIATWPSQILAKVPGTGEHYITAEIDLEHLREHRANSRMHHQRRPEVYGPIVQQHEPWAVYERNE
ncbi:MAG TPA: carbon-nitrogen hydrolase family protein [Candidatus Hydrogenedentes bacterium]|nr:carbon-nitrogen hydrolase family protein [Candidatus Hydrogenedentota bacterium]HPG65450.1 carbon-nitrogen hydrolase family protein [Candidatus Hydrogenedentota bacterium]